MLRGLRPRSTLTLTLVAFGVVTLPLFAALGVAGVYVDRLADQGQTSVRNAARAMQNSSRVNQTLNTMERNARQYLVLGEPAMLRSYEDSHQSFQQNVERLDELMAKTRVNDQIRAIATLEARLYERLSDEAARGELSQQKVATSFTRLRALAQAISAGSRQVIDEEVTAMETTSNTAQRWLIWLGTALIPLTLVSTAVFTVLISRPIRRLDHAIRQLGDTGLDQPIAITGPEDLRAVGERLDWLRRRLRDLEGDRTRFLRHVSHELKTPLTAVRESGELLQSGAAGHLNSEQREITDILNDSARRLQELIENLLDFARTQSRHRSLAVSHVDMPAVIETVLREHRPEIQVRGLRIRTHLRPSRLEGDETKLKTVIDNLISNAVKFSPANGQLTVTCVASGSWAVISVADEGPGIPAEDQERIFEAFTQGQRQTVSELGGSGLGLSIVREYVRAHGGHITIVNTYGPGTRIRVEIPRGASGKGAG